MAVAALGKPMVVVLVNGRSLAIPRIVQKAAALLEAWYPGQEGGHALTDVLFGRANPSGKLPVSIPRSAAQLPVYYTRRQRMGWYIDEKSEPLFPFGFGLSYTRFEYGEMTITPARGTERDQFMVSVELRNAGKRDGEEIVQLYIEPTICALTTPVKRLAGFRRVAVKAGESCSVGFTLTGRELEQWDRDFQRRVVAGEYKVTMGPDCVSGVTTTLRIVE